MFNWFSKPEAPKQDKPRASFFSTHAIDTAPRIGFADILHSIVSFLPKGQVEGAADDMNISNTAKLNMQGATTLSDALVMWYASQGFIGHQIAGMLMQNWLINKACTIPARDAVRKGYNIVSIDGEDLDDEASKKLKRYDRAFKVNDSMVEFIRKGRGFGVRIALFKIESTDPDYYEKPFNPDGITPNSYKGIVQVDPYWCAPELTIASASQPDSLQFYEPTYWIINGKRHHRSHLIIFRNAEPVDILKPQYLYGGVPVPQQIMERVYAAERTANEAPQLAQTKRMNVWLTDMEKFAAKGDSAIEAMNNWTYYRDNYGVKMGDKEGDEFAQFDTSLADLDSVIMTQYQIVAAAANVPATKLLGTSPKGFNATGEYEESNYHEELESIQTADLTPFLERHHLCVMRSFVPKELWVDTTIAWNPLDSPTAKELADTNLSKAQVGAQLIASGAISSEDERRRVAMDKESGYHEIGLDDLIEEDDTEY